MEPKVLKCKFIFCILAYKICPPCSTLSSLLSLSLYMHSDRPHQLFMHFCPCGPEIVLKVMTVYPFFSSLANSVTPSTRFPSEDTISCLQGHSRIWIMFEWKCKYPPLTTCWYCVRVESDVIRIGVGPVPSRLSVALSLQLKPWEGSSF